MVVPKPGKPSLGRANAYPPKFTARSLHVGSTAANLGTLVPPGGAERLIATAQRDDAGAKLLKLNVCCRNSKNPPCLGANFAATFVLSCCQQLGAANAMKRQPDEVDPWHKAAECARAIEIVADPERRLVLSSLRGVWLALGNQPSFRNRAGSGVQMSTLAQIHHELMSQCRNAMH